MILNMEALALGIDQTCPIEHDQSLVEQARDLPRDKAMKQVVGPALDRFVRPIYDAPLTADEVSNLPEVTAFKDLPDFSRSTDELLKARLDSRLANEPDQCQILEGVAQGRPDLFHYSLVKNTLVEGVEVGARMPLIVGTHIYILERYGSGLSYNEKQRLPYDGDLMIDILRRSSTYRILDHLTKGPNGFLGGSASVSYTAFERKFFDFREQNNRCLLASEAYQQDQGQVIGLSAAYHLVAASRRQKIKEEYYATERFGALGNTGGHAFAISSGCPVRHRFEDESGEPQESLISAGRQFVIAALQAEQAATRAEA
jgi:hypothetical protein